MDAGTKARRLSNILSQLEELAAESDAKPGSPLGQAVAQVRSCWHSAYVAHTGELAVAALRENRTRLFAEIDDEQFDQIIRRLGGTTE